jgi:demethoxyubiquinone hydroxylase (CLK1/Coq7/Cat5 family)
MADARFRLIRLLQQAYSGERAAAGAYAGHWRSLGDPEEREAVRRIEGEEWDHRARVGRMLESLGAAPSRRLELQAAVIGAALGPLCHVSGWLLPMFGAAWLERCNVAEYAQASGLAQACGRPDLAPDLAHMSRVELEHEAYFRDRVASHRFGVLATRLLGRPSTEAGDPAAPAAAAARPGAALPR